MSAAADNPICRDAGAYVLGVLPAADNAGFTAHLWTCSECQTQVGEFVGLLPLLQLQDRAVDVGAGKAVRDEVRMISEAGRVEMTRADRGRRHGRRDQSRRPIRWAAAVLVAVALLGSAFALTRPRPVLLAQPVEATPTAAAAAMIRTFPGLGRASVQVRVSAADPGSTMMVLCSGELDKSAAADPGTRLVSLWVVTRSGSHIEVTAWTDMQGSTTIAGRSTVAPADIVMLELRGANGQPLSQVAA